MTYYIDPEIYKKYRDAVIELAQSIQINYPENLSPEKRRPGLSDEQIAAELGIEVNVARETLDAGGMTVGYVVRVYPTTVDVLYPPDEYHDKGWTNEEEKEERPR